MISNILQMPGKIVIEENSPTYGVFSWGPLEKGYVYSIGNAIRRVLLSSISGHAITHIKLPQNVLHEFDTINGVVEDMTDIILNLKKVRVKKISEGEGSIRVKINNQTEFTAQDIQKATQEFEIINPDVVICHLDGKTSFELELIVQEGRGYSLAEDHKPQDQVFGEVSIDALFSPVVNVEIIREDALVGSRTDYEQFIIKITTNGTKDPESCFKEAAGILREHFALLSSEKVAIVAETDEPLNNIDQEIENFRNLVKTPLSKLDLSPRVVNHLMIQNVTELGHLATLEMSDILKIRNLGKKSIKEIDTVVKSHGLHFGMDIKGYTKNK